MAEAKARYCGGCGVKLWPRERNFCGECRDAIGRVY